MLLLAAFIHSLADAAEWSPATNVHPQTDLPDGYPEIVHAADGTTWIAWMGIDPVEGDEEAYFSRWNGNSWDSPATINLPNQTDDRFPRLSCSPLGALWATWTSLDPTGTGYSGMTSHWTGSAWSSPDTIWTGGGRYDYVETQAVSDLEAWFVRDGAGSGGSRDVFVYHLAGGSLGPVQQFVQPETQENLPSITVGSDGMPWVVWYQIPGPPPNPSNSRLQVSHLESGNWSLPETLPAPLAINRPGIVAGPDARRWIICTAPDPSVGAFSSAIWALENSGSGWTAPLRISNYITAADSSQYQMSVGRTCGGYPRVVWLARDIDVYTRVDMLTTSFTGSTWAPVERVGVLSDSAYVSWPALTYANGRRWVAYMRDVAPTFVSNVYTTYSDDPPTAAASTIKLEGAAVDDGVRLTWPPALVSPAALARVWRAEGHWDLAPPNERIAAAMIRTVPQIYGGIFDESLHTGSEYTYWVEVVADGGRGLWGGPVTIRVLDGRSITKIIGVHPNPSRGVVGFRYTLGSLEPAYLEIFDAGGRLLRRRSIAKGGSGQAELSMEWDGRDHGAMTVPSGVYFARIRAGGTGSLGDPVRFVLIR